MDFFVQGKSNNIKMGKIYMTSRALLVVAIALYAGCVGSHGGECDIDKEGECTQCWIDGTPCFATILQCPDECPQRIPDDAYEVQGCWLDCVHDCEAICLNYRPGCGSNATICYDPRFIGGDGVMFYFHGKSNEDFAIVSDNHLQINAHFIGRRPEGRTRDFTWVQSLGVMFGNHTFTVGANKVAEWNDAVGHLFLSFDGKSVSIPQGRQPQLKAIAGNVIVERTAQTNSIIVQIPDLVEILLNVVPVTKEDDRIHNYQIRADDCFAHLELHFKFFGLSSEVEGALGRTYRPHFKNPVKVGVPMPIMGGDEKYRTSSLVAADCKSCIFKQHSGFSQNSLTESVISLDCTGKGGKGKGILCRR